MPRMADGKPVILPFGTSVAARRRPVTTAERHCLEGVQRQALAYFLENQQPHGLILDRQRNHAAPVSTGLCSMAATGMGLVALALASTPEYGLLRPQQARERIAGCLETVLARLPHEQGMLPHFVDASTLAPVGHDRISTIDSSWLAAGALWAAVCLGDAKLQGLADHVYRRMNWRYWTDHHTGWLRHGSDSTGQPLPNYWDRLNGETAFMYVLGVGGRDECALSPACWGRLRTCHGRVEGHRFASADLGLFVWQYSLELLDFERYTAAGTFDLYAQARTATWANYLACRAAARDFVTYRSYWGLSAGDGPGAPGDDVYRCYAPAEQIDGTAHLTAALASLSTWPELVLTNLSVAERESRQAIRGRYGFSNVNLDRHWVSRDVVGIDLGAAVLAIDNFVHHGRVRRLFHTVQCVRLGMERLRLQQRVAGTPGQRQAA